MNRFDQLWIWDSDDYRNKLRWYRDVESNRKPAKFRIAEHVPVDICSPRCEERVLWDELNGKTTVFLKRWHRIRDGLDDLPMGPKPRPNLVDLCRELTQRMLCHCNFCRWNCRVDRSAGTKFGACKLAGASRVSSYFHHPGEELIYRGNEGSGTIFFTSCNLRCAFCQNGDISTDKDNGSVVSPRTLATMAWLLRMEGCHNINWVGGEVTIHLHAIVEAISLLTDLQPDTQDIAAAIPMKNDYFYNFSPKPEGALYRHAINTPMLWNSNFFMSDEAMKILRILMDIWLPDLKFGSEECGVKLSRTPWYWETVTKNIKTIYDWNEEFTIRHLVMPNHVECCTRPILQWIADTMPDVQVNIMDQYHPDNFCNPGSRKYNSKYEEIARRPTSKELQASYAYARVLNLNYESTSFEKRMSRNQVY